MSQIENKNRKYVETIFFDMREYFEISVFEISRVDYIFEFEPLEDDIFTKLRSDSSLL